MGGGGAGSPGGSQGAPSSAHSGGGSGGHHSQEQAPALASQSGGGTEDLLELPLVASVLGEEVVVAGDPVACRSWLVRATGSPPPGPPYQAGGYAWPPGEDFDVKLMGTPR